MKIELLFSEDYTCVENIIPELFNKPVFSKPTKQQEQKYIEKMIELDKEVNYVY